MDELFGGIVHWTAIHPNTGLRSHSAFHVASGTLIDPMVPDEGLGWFERHPPQRAVLTNRHHLRDAPDFAGAFGIPILAHPAGMHEFENGPDVRPVEPGDSPAPGVTVVEFGAITPEEVALHLDCGPGVIALADGIVRVSDGSLGFFPDELLGDDPQAVKEDIKAAARRVVEEWEFDALLLAHGKPRSHGGKAELKRFAC